MTKRTKTCKTRYIVFTLASTLLWIGCALFSLISAFTKISNPAVGGGLSKVLSEDFKAMLLGLGTTMIIALILTIFMSNKMRMTVWMFSVLLSTIVYGEVAMYSIFAIWFLDEYIVHALAKHYKAKYSINMEIDARG